LQAQKRKNSSSRKKRKAKKETRDYFDKLKESKRTGAPPPPKGKKHGVPAAAAADQPPKGRVQKAVPQKTSTRPGTKPGTRAGNKPGAKPVVEKSEEMPLNKFIAHSGICSRRDAAGLVAEGKITVNDKVMITPGYKVQPNDVVKMGKQTLTIQSTPIYILLNKPKDCLTTVDDPQGRDTVLRYIRNATSERVYPVGRLDRNTTGVLILTNDGELAQRLTHPSFEVRKIYEVRLETPLEKGHYDKIVNGITLEDGFIAPDALAYTDVKDKTIIGIEIHSGRNRIVRRIFEYFGYKIKTLDRVSFANLTKKNVERGKWRFLMEREVRNLKFMNTSAIKKKKV